MMNNEAFLSAQFDVLGEFVPDLLMLKVSDNVVDDVDQASYSRTFIHEFSHWMQFTGTNWGFMQLLLGQEPINEIINLGLYGNVKDHLEGFRKMQIDERFQVILPKEYEATRSIAQNWLDSFVTKKIFSSGTNTALLIPGADQTVAMGLCDYTCTVNFLLDQPEQNIDALEKIFRFPDLIGMRLSPVDDFTTFDLIEGQAKINEVLHEISLQAISTSIFQIDFTKFLRGEYPAVYSKAFKVYCEQTNKDFKFDKHFELRPFIEACIEFCVIVDASLAIMAPPFVPQSAYQHISWQALYPPIRFYRLCEAAAEMNFKFDNQLNKKLYEEFVTAACKGARLINPIHQTQFFLENHHHAIADLERKWNFKTLKVENLRGITDFLIFLLFKFNQLRQEQPEMICLPGWADVTAKLVKLQWDKDYYWLHCPFEVRGDKFYNRIPTELEGLSGYLIGLLTTNKVIEQHIFRNIPLNEMVLPYIDQKLKGMVCRYIKHLIGIDLNWI